MKLFCTLWIGETRKHFFRRGKNLSCPLHSKCIKKSEMSTTNKFIFSFLFLVSVYPMNRTKNFMFWLLWFYKVWDFSLNTSCSKDILLKVMIKQNCLNAQYVRLVIGLRNTWRNTLLMNMKKWHLTAVTYVKILLEMPHCLKGIS